MAVIKSAIGTADGSSSDPYKIPGSELPTLAVLSMDMLSKLPMLAVLWMVLGPARENVNKLNIVAGYQNCQH